MQPDVFAAMRLKLERADKHIVELGDILQTFHKSGVYETGAKTAPDGVTWMTIKRVKNAPEIVAVIVGEVVYQLRSILDHLACALARQHSGTDKEVYFPFAAGVEEFWGARAQGKISKLSSAAQLFINKLQPYKGGNDFLWSLNRLGNIDKHSSSIAIQAIGFHMAADGVLHTADGPNFLEFRHEPISMPDPVASQNLDFVFRDFPVSALNEDVEVLGVSPGSSFQGKIDVSFKVAFGDVDVVKGEPVFTTLQQYFQLVRSICIQAESTFFPSTEESIK